MTERLPFNFKCELTTECWTFYKLGIITSDNKFLPWFIEHFNNYYLNEKFNMQFGKNCANYRPLDYYNEVLSFKEYNLNQIVNENILYNLIIETIDENNYIVVNCDYYFLPNSKSYHQEHYIHEMVIYGYATDDKNVYYLGHNDFGWVEYSVNYFDLWQAFNGFRSFYYSNALEDYVKRIYNYPITIISLNNIYNNKYPKLDIIYDDLKELCLGGEHNISFTDNDRKVYNRRLWNGSAVYLGLDNFIEEYLIKKSTGIDLSECNIPKSFKALLGIKTSLLNKMLYLNKSNIITLPEKTIADLINIQTSIETMLLLILKYYENGNSIILSDIRERLISTFCLDRLTTYDLMQIIKETNMNNLVELNQNNEHLVYKK